MWILEGHKHSVYSTALDSKLCLASILVLVCFQHGSHSDPFKNVSQLISQAYRHTPNPLAHQHTQSQSKVSSEVSMFYAIWTPFLSKLNFCHLSYPSPFPWHPHWPPPYFMNMQGIHLPALSVSSGWTSLSPEICVDHSATPLGFSRQSLFQRGLPDYLTKCKLLPCPTSSAPPGPTLFFSSLSIWSSNIL